MVKREKNSTFREAESLWSHSYEKGWKTHWDVYISTQIFPRHHAAKDSLAHAGQGRALNELNQTDLRFEWERGEHFGFHLPPS